MKIRLALLATLIFSIASPTLSIAAGDRFALVIGNAKYPDADAPLKEPVNDARDVADELKRDGFTVEVGENLTGDGMHRAFDRLYGKIKPGSVALIFFSGYGIQSNRQSYMIPIDAQIWAEADVRRDGPHDLNAVYEFRIDDSVACLRLLDGRVTVTPGPPATTGDVTVRASAATVASIVGRKIDVHDALADGRLEVTGEPAAVAALVGVIEKRLAR